MEPLPEQRLQAGEEVPTNHDHAEVPVTAEALRDHLTFDHLTLPPEGLSFGALQGIHDRFHGEGHAVDE